jgi:hypothetical protein
MVIWKWDLGVFDRQEISIPIGARMLDVQMQGGDPKLRALCHQTKEMERRAIAVYGTGNPIPHPCGEYIATFQMGHFVWHAFDLGPVA